MIYRLKEQANNVERHRVDQVHLDQRRSEYCGLATPRPETLTSTTTASLLELATEIHLQIIQKLSMLETLALKLSCSYFNKLIAASRILPVRDRKHRFMNMHVRKVETWSHFASRDLYGCTCCGRLRPTQNFDEDELAMAKTWHKRRMCYNCKVHCKADNLKWRLARSLHCMECESYAPDEDIGVWGLCSICENELFDSLE